MKLKLFAVLLLFFVCAGQSLHAQKEIELINSGDIIKTAVKLHDEGKYDEAISQYEQIGRNDTNYARACYEEAYSAYSLGKYDTVFRLCKILMDMDDYTGSEAYTLYGSALDDKDSSAKAIDFYNMAISKFPKSYLLHFNLGVAYFRQGKYDDAYRCFKRTLEINPRHSTSHYFLGLLLADSKRWAPAMLALNTALMLDPSKSTENKCLNYLINIAKGDYTPLKEGAKLSEPEDPNFAKIDKLIDSKVALNAGYEIAAKIDDKLMKQNQFLLETMKKSKPVTDNYFVKQYVPLYMELIETQNLKTFEYYPYKDVDNEIVGKWKSKNKKDIQEYDAWIMYYFDKTYAEFVDTVNGKPQKFKRYVYSNGAIEALGTDYEPKTETRKGYWRIFFTNSNVEWEGNYDNSGKRQGEWKRYYANGKLNTVANYRDGKVQGQVKDYFMNGNIKRDAAFKDDFYQGKVLQYYNSGSPASENNYISGGITDGKVKTYYQNGNLSQDIDAKHDKKDGKYIKYDAHGYISYTAEYKTGLMDGQYISYWPNGREKSKGMVKADKEEGKWVYFDEYGKQIKEMEYVKSNITGNVKEYYSNGKLSSDETYDNKGKLTGLLTYYDDDGIKYFEGTYKDGNLAGYKYFDKTGKVLHEASESHGELEFKAFNAAGQLSKEGMFRKGNREGKWTYYFGNGTVRLTENYVADVLSGPFQEFYKSGVLHKEGTYKKGDLAGHYLVYFENEKLQEEFILAGGMREGDSYSYYMNGKVAGHNYYTAGDETGWQSSYYPNGKLDYEYYDEESFMSKYFVYDTMEKVSDKFLNPQVTAAFNVKYFNGKPKVNGNYKQGHLDGLYKNYYSNGQEDGESNYRNAYRNGPAKEYHSNGKLMKEAWYKNGEADSVWTEYDRDGIKENSGTYKEDERNGYFRWFYPNGKVEFLVKYKDGDKDSTATMYAPDGTVRVKLKYLNAQLISYT